MLREVKKFIIGSIFLTLLIAGTATAELDLSRLLLYWPCDDGSGDVLADESGNGFNGEILGGDHSWEAGKSGKAVRLQNAYGMVQGNVIETTGATGEITLVCWFFMNDHVTYDGLISIEAPVGDCCEYRLMVNPNFNPFWNAGHHADKSLATFMFELETWYHYALTADGESGKIYVDGEFIGEQAEGFPLPDFPEVTVYLGTGESPGTWPVEDTIFDDVMIWDKALTVEEINQLMEGELLAVQPQGKLAVKWAKLKSQ